LDYIDKRDWKEPRIKIFIGIKSKTTNFKQREGIRSSWINYFKDPESQPLTKQEKSSFEYRFMTGEPSKQECDKFINCRPSDTKEVHRAIQAENDTYGDVVMLPVVEYYLNLTLKMIHLFKHVAQYDRDTGESLTHYVGIDDDAYVRIDLLLNALRDMPTSRVYAGRVHREINNVEPKSMYHLQKYPDFVTGLLYILSMDLVHYLSSATNLFHRYNLDDCGLAIWLLPINKKVIDMSDTVAYADPPEKIKFTNLVCQHRVTPPRQLEWYQLHQATPDLYGFLLNVQDAEGPHRYKVTVGCASAGWRASFSFRAFSYPHPGTRRIFVQQAFNPHRFILSFAEYNWDWEPLYSFYAYTSQMPGTTRINVQDSTNPPPHRFRVSTGDTYTGWRPVFTFYAEIVNNPVCS